MRTDSPTRPTPDAEPALPREQAPNKVATARPGWEDFLLGKKIRAARFLEKLRKGPIPVLDGGARTRLAAEAVKKKGGFERLLDLTQSSVGSLPSIRETALDLATAGLEFSGISLPPYPGSPHAYSHRVLAWLEDVRRPLKNEQLRILLLLLHVGVARYSLDRESAFELLARAMPPAKEKRGRQREPTAAAHRSPEEVLILADPTPAGLTTLLAYETAVSGERRRLEGQIQGQAVELTQLRSRLSETDAALGEARAEIRRLQQERERAVAEIEALRKEIVDVHGDYKYKLYDLRGHVRGALGGQLTQWLRTALDAACATPPRTGAIQERLEDALSLIDKEMEWLQPSD